MLIAVIIILPQVSGSENRNIGRHSGEAENSLYIHAVYQSYTRGNLSVATDIQTVLGDGQLCRVKLPRDTCLDGSHPEL